MTRSGWQRKKKTVLLLKTFHAKNIKNKTPGCRKLNNSSDMQNDVLIHRDGLTISAWGSTLGVRI